MEVEIGTKTFDQCVESSSCKEVLYLAALINLKTVLEMLYFINQQSPAPTAANICNCPRPIKTHYINANDTESLMHAFNALQIMSFIVNTLFWACMENYLCPKTIASLHLSMGSLSWHSINALFTNIDGVLTGFCIFGMCMHVVQVYI